MTSYYQEKLESGLQYQDFIVEELYKRGIILIQIVSCAGQYRIGENMMGLEIKHDEKLKETGNIYIETEERTSPDILDFTPSGIYRADNSWLYGIGDRSVFFIFSKKWLQWLDQVDRPPVSIRRAPAGMGTANGFILTATDAETWAARTIRFKETHRALRPEPDLTPLVPIP